MIAVKMKARDELHHPGLSPLFKSNLNRCIP